MNVPILRVDMSAMIELDLQTLRENPTWLDVLCAYRTAIEELVASEATQSAAKPGKKSGGRDTDAGVDDSETSNSDEDLPDAPVAVTPDAATPDTEADSDSSNSDEDDQNSRRRSSRWIPRLKGVDGVESVDLSKIHGRLIAYGFLKCDLTDRDAGVVYQLTAEAKQILSLVDGDESLSEGDELRADVA